MPPKTAPQQTLTRGGSTVVDNRSHCNPTSSTLYGSAAAAGLLRAAGRFMARRKNTEGFMLNNFQVDLFRYAVKIFCSQRWFLSALETLIAWKEDTLSLT